MRLIPIMFSIVLVGCGPSQEDKQRVAAVACGEIKEVPGLDTAARYRIMNDAREEIGGEPFLDGDAKLQTALAYELCESLVLNPLVYEQEKQSEIERQINDVLVLQCVIQRDDSERTYRTQLEIDVGSKTFRFRGEGEGEWETMEVTAMLVKSETIEFSYKLNTVSVSVIMSIPTLDMRVEFFDVDDPTDISRSTGECSLYGDERSSWDLVR